MSDNILVFGESGQIANELRSLVIKKNNYFFLNSEKCNFLNSEQISFWIRKIKPKIIINTSAYTNVEQAEREDKKAFLINSQALKIISYESLKIDAVLIHFSTDFVFDGMKKSSYIESDLTNPLNVYGKTKLMGETQIQKLLTKYFILRTSWVHSPYGDNFLKKIIKIAQSKKTINVTDIEIGTPNAAFFLANSVIQIINSFLLKEKINVPYGLYHLSSIGSVSRYDYAKYILKIAKKHKFNLLCDDNSVERSLLQNNNCLRPKYSVLNSNLFKNCFNINIPRWQNDVIQSIKRTKR